MATWRHIRAILVLPAMNLIALPALLVALTDSFDPGWGLPAPLGALPIVLGGGSIVCGLALMSRTISLFATIGHGTLAPWDPTQKLVIRGPYRHVRNPMISGVLMVLLGEAALLGSPPVFAWFAIFGAINVIYTPLVEERSLARRFGDDYLRYRRNVPRWIPRLRPWEPG